jgi:carbon-monoxide dehydrogenase large subunit
MNTVGRMASDSRSAAGRSSGVPGLLLGADRFLADIDAPGCLRVVFVRSSYAHGRVRAIRTDEAAASPGVVAIYAGMDLGVLELTDSESGPEGAPMRRPVLAAETVRFAGEAIALVVGTSLSAAIEAAALVEADIEPLPVVTDPHEALTGSVLLFPELGTNLVKQRTEALGRTPSSWPASVVVQVRNQRVAASPLETLGITVIPGRRPRLTVWCGSQTPHSHRDMLATLLGLEPADIRFRVPRVGGGFGLKGVFHPEYAAVAATALRLDRPISWLADRREELLAGTHGRDQHGTMTLSGEPDGRIHRADVDVLADLGAYPVHGGGLTVSTRLMATGPYDIPEVTIRIRTVVTNKAPIGPYRGAGRPEAAYLLERAIDAYARHIGADPAAVRRRNMIAAGALPRQVPTGAVYDSGDFTEALNRALTLAEAPAVRRDQAARRSAGDDPIGLGIGVYMDRGGGGITSGEYARVEVDPGGRVVVRTGSTDSGQGHAPTWARLVADTLTVPAVDIRVVAGDTFEVAQGVGTFGSRSTHLGASAAIRSAARVVEEARAIAADRLEARPDDLELEHGAFHVAGVPSIRVPLHEIAAGLVAAGRQLAAEEYYIPGAVTFPYGVFVAVVEVERATGTVTVRHIAAVNDCGRLMDPRLAEDQVVGSIAQGIGQALREEIIYDESGQLLTSTLADYLLPGATDVPRISLGWLQTPAASNPLGAKGIGESGCVGVPQAIVNATIDALAPLGVTDLDMPLTPDRVWLALRTKRPA